MASGGLQGWGGRLFSPRPTGKRASEKKEEQDHPTGDPRVDPGREGEEAQLPRRPCAEGETAACGGPAGGHGGGAQRAGAEGEPRRHGCPGLSAVSKRQGVWDALVALKPRRAANHRCGPAPAWREAQTPAVAETRPQWAEEALKSTFRRSPRARAQPAGSEPAAQGTLGRAWGRRARGARWDKAGLPPRFQIKPGGFSLSTSVSTLR